MAAKHRPKSKSFIPRQFAAAQCDQAFALHTAGDLEGAAQGYRQVLAREPGHARALYLFGSVRGQQERWAEAMPLLEQAVTANPSLAEAHLNLGIARQILGHWAGAIEAYDGALSLRPSYAAAHNGRGLTLQKLGRREESTAAYTSAVEHDPSHTDAWNNLGVVLQEQGHWNEAMACFRQAVAVRPAFAQAHNNLGIVLHKQGDEEAALLACEQALAISPSFAEAHNNRGAILKALGRLKEASDAFTCAVEANPAYADAHYNLGNLCDLRGRTEDAIACYSRAIDIAPAHVDAHWNRSLSSLLAGRFAEGWAEYDWRWQTDQFDAKPFPQPRWDGSNLNGQSILVYVEQGFGDTLQFARCLPWIKAQGAGHVVFAVQNGLGALLANFPGVDTLIECRPDGTFPPGVPYFDVQIPLLSVPGLMGIDLENMPAPVPFATDAERRAGWPKQFASQDGLKVGLVWAGRPEHRNNKSRSLTLADFAPLADVPGVQFYSLQKGDAGKAASCPPPGMRIIDLAPALHDFADTAAALSHLDLLICVDTSCAHLAGTLGIPTWTLLPFAPDWRWLKDRTDTPWYPSLRLFRQSAPGDWAGVFAQVQAELATEAQAPSLVRSKVFLSPMQAPVPGEPETPSAPRSERAVASLSQQKGMEAISSAPRVSVVIPCYKQAQFLAEAVRSVAEQTFPDWELIIVNDGSPDSTSRVAHTLILTRPTLRIQLIEQENAGLPAARNAGIRAAQGQYILPLDADDHLHPDFLARTVAVLDSHPEVGIAHTDIQHFGADSGLFQTGPFTPGAMTQENRLAYCSLYRREVWEKNGGYCEQFDSYEDWDFWLGALEQGVQAVRVPEALFCYRKAERSMLTEADKRRPQLMAQIVARRPKLFLPARRALAQETCERLAQEHATEIESMGGTVKASSARRILLVTDQFWPSVGGSERLTEDVALGLMAEGWQVEVMAAARPDRCDFLHRGMRIQSCPASTDPAAFLRRLTETRSFDCVLSFVGHWSPFNAAAADLPEGVRMVAVPCINADGYDHATHIPAVRETFARLGKRAQVTARSSDAGFDARLWQELDIPTVYLPNAIDCVPPADMSFRAAHGIPEGVPLLLHVGNFYHEKNHAGLLNHLRAKEGDWRLVLIGKPGHVDTFTHTHAQVLAALDPRVLVIPGAARDEVAAAMEAADLLLLSSVAEATPLVLLEAMSHRLPWIATPRCGSAPDHAGGLVATLDAFGDAIDFLMARPEARQVLGAAGHAHWQACYTWDKIAPRYALLAGGANELPALLPPPGAREETDALRAEFAAAQEGQPSQTHLGPAVSVVISTHNREGLLRKVLRSYETQTLPRSEWEVVVVDDGSTDGTARFLQNYKAPYNLVVETLSPNRGLSAARNAGILRARGEILIFQDDDDAATPEYLAEHLRVHRQHPDTLIGVFGVIEPAAEIADSVLYHVLTSEHGLYNYFDDLQDGQVLDFRHFWGNVSSVKKELLMQFGFFDPDTRWGMDDAELGWRLQRRNLRMVVNRRARLQAIRTLSFDEFCGRQKGQGRAAAWLLRKHPEHCVPFWLNVANAEQRLLSLADGWGKVQAARSQFAVLEKAGLQKLQTSPGWESLRQSLAALCRIASEQSLLAGFAERRAEFEAQDALQQPLVRTDKLVSVIVPCYNYARFLTDAIASLVAQTYPHWEAVIVDDGSTDNSVDVAHEMIARYPGHKIRLIEQPNTGHPSYARNRGFAETDGPYVLCLDADDELAPTFLSECVGLLERNPALSIAYTDQMRFTEDGKEERFYAGDYHLGHLTQYLPWGVFALYRRQAGIDVGGWKPVGYEDWDFWLSCAEKGHTGLRISRPLARYRKHREGKYLRDKSEGLRHKARLTLHHPKLFSADAVRRAEGVVSAYDYLEAPQDTLPEATVSVVILQTGDDSAESVMQSVRAQTLAPCEVISVPEDDLGRVLPQLTGKYVAFLPEGGAWRANHLATLGTFLEETGAHAAYTDREDRESTDFDPTLLLIENFVPTGALVVHRAAFLACGGLDHSLPAGARLWDGLLRLSQYGTVLRLPTTTAREPERALTVRDVLAVYEKHRARADASVLAAQKGRLEERAAALATAQKVGQRRAA